MPETPSRLTFQGANAFEAQHAARLRADLGQQAGEAAALEESALEAQLANEAAHLGADDVVTSAAIQALARENGWRTGKVAEVLARHNGDGDGLYDEAEFDRMMAEVQAGEDRAMLDDLYREHLGREPDGEGLATWGAKIEELRAEGKTDAEIEEALTPFITGSPEYQVKNPEVLLENLYQLHLGREPDPEGLATWTAKIQELKASGLGDQEVIDAMHPFFTESPEYKALHPDPAPAVAGAPAAAADPAAVDGTQAATPAGQPVAAGAVPYINQLHPNGADGNYWNGPSNCGPTSMAMIARAMGYGQDMTDAQLINHLGAIGGTNGDGTGWAGIVAMGNAMGTGVEQNYGDPAWIAAQLQAGKHVIANGDYYAMPPHDASKTGSGGHYVTIVGMDENGNFLVNDPYDTSIQATPYTPAQISHFLRSNSNHGGQVFAVG